MVYRNMRQAHLQEVGLTKIPGDHDFFNIFSNMTYFRANFMADSMIDSKTDKHHHGSWLMCEVAISIEWNTIMQLNVVMSLFCFL